MHIVNLSINHWLIFCGISSYFLSKNETQFARKCFATLFFLLNIKPMATTAYHAKKNSQAERIKKAIMPPTVITSLNIKRIYTSFRNRSLMRKIRWFIDRKIKWSLASYIIFTHRYSRFCVLSTRHWRTFTLKHLRKKCAHYLNHASASPSAPYRKKSTHFSFFQTVSTAVQAQLWSSRVSNTDVQAKQYHIFG